MKAIRFAKTGGPEVLGLEEIELPAPGPGQVRVRHTAIGVNFIDTYHRSGLYPAPLPATPGGEAAGVVEALDEGVTGFKFLIILPVLITLAFVFFMITLPESFDGFCNHANDKLNFIIPENTLFFKHLIKAFKCNELFAVYVYNDFLILFK